MNHRHLSLFGLLMTGMLAVGCSATEQELSASSDGQNESPETWSPSRGKTGDYNSAGGNSGNYPGANASGSSGNNMGESAGNKTDETENAGAGGASGEAGADACANVDPSQSTTLYLSADDSNSMASAALVRNLIRQGQLPPSNIVRPYEFLNYYNVAYEAPAPGQLNVVPQMRPGKETGDFDLQIGVQSAKPQGVRRPMNLTLVLDTSGSMSGTPITLQKAAVKALATQLRSGDIISITTWNTSTVVALEGHTVQGPNDEKLLSIIDSLTAGGGTDLHAGLVNGYNLAKKYYKENRTNRVIVISDGEANVGITDEQMIGKEADIENKEGIYLVGIGVGYGVNDTLLNVVTDAGNGAYLYLDSEEEAQRMLANRFDEVIEIAARDVQVSMTIPSYFSIVKFSGEQYSTDPTKVKPQHLAPGDAMVISQTLRACSPTIVQPSDPVHFEATWIEPGTWQPRKVGVDLTVGSLQEQSDAQLRRGLAIVAYADAVKKGGNCKNRIPLVADAIAALDAADPQHNDEALIEIRDLVTQFGAVCN